MKSLWCFLKLIAISSVYTASFILCSLFFQGKFSTKSDVWSFAVTLWEILIFAREQPFLGMSDEEVIENYGHYCRNSGQEVCLPMPSICPKEIFDLMRECWNRDDLQRPSFREIHMFLQRKNMGYNPAEEGQTMLG